MKKSLLLPLLLLICSTAGVICFARAEAAVVAAGTGGGAGGALNVKLPYAKGESFVVTTGYSSPPTHIKKDAYAIDFTQNGCDAYGKPAVAAVSGTVWVVQEDGYNGGYGTQLLVIAGGVVTPDASTVVARYAHMIPDSVVVGSGDPVRQGMALGKIGDTGLVAGTACAAHPGAHLHFALYNATSSGGSMALSTSTFTAHNPEPISGYANIQEGKWYLSDNGSDAGVAAGAAAGVGAVLGAAIEKQVPLLGASSSAPIVAAAPVIISTATSTATNFPIPLGGAGIVASVSASPPPPSQVSNAPISSAPQNPSTGFANSSDTVMMGLATNSPETGAGADGGGPGNFSGSFNSSTLAVDFSWQQPPVATGTATRSVPLYSLFDLGLGDASSSAADVVASATTVTTTIAATTTTSTTLSYPVPGGDFGRTIAFELQAADGSGTVFTFPESTVAIPDWLDVIQPDADAGSIPSWYDDNWYNLGTGFYGTIKSLTFRGAVDTDRYPLFGGGTMEIDEYLDASYTQPNQAFAISGDTPFTNQVATATFSGLNIPLQPNKYYRLATVGPLQNHSVVLAGTTAIGTAMWDEFVNGTGIVRHTYPFYPYISAIMVPNWPPLAPPSSPVSLSFSFDQFALTLGVSWPAAIDPDTTTNLLTYQFNVATSSAGGVGAGGGALDPTHWQPLGKNLGTSIAVAVGNTYTVGVRAIDDFGNVGASMVQTWNFPAGFVPYLLSGGLSMASQDFTLAPSSSASFTASGTLLHSINLFTANLSSGSRFPEFNWCTLDLYDLAPSSAASGGAPSSTAPVPVYLASNDGLVQGYTGCQNPTFVFDSSAVQLVPNHPYRWVFNMNTGNPSTGAAVQFWGTATNAAGGAFSDPELVNAKFAVNASSGVLFAN